MDRKTTLHCVCCGSQALRKTDITALPARFRRIGKDGWRCRACGVVFVFRVVERRPERPSAPEDD